MLRIRRSYLEYAVVVYEVFLLLIAAYFFHVRPNTELFETFSRDLGIALTGDTFVVLCLIGCVMAVFVLLERVRWRQQLLYSMASFPLVVYSVAIGVYMARTRTPGLSVVVYLIVAIPLWLLALTTFRDSVDVIVRSRSGGHAHGPSTE